MGPVSFEAIGTGLDRQDLLALARALGDQGIRATMMERGRSGVDAGPILLIRSEHMARAEAIFAASGLLDRAAGGATETERKR